jgi:NADH dehydrogenase
VSSAGCDRAVHAVAVICGYDGIRIAGFRRLDEHDARPRPHVVIVGGGFAGISAARALRHADVRVTLIDRRVYNTFQPLLYQVATGGLNPGDVTHFLRSLRVRQPNLDVVHEHLMEIDPEARTVRLLDGQEVSYDYLLVANGVTTAYHGTPGAKENSFAVYSRSQAIAIRDALFTRLERAAVLDGAPRACRSW